MSKATPLKTDSHLRILWALDPFAEKPLKTARNPQAFIQNLQKTLNAQVEPIYVMSQRTIDLPGDLGSMVDMFSFTSYQRKSQESMMDLIEELGVDALTPVILPNEKGSLETAVTCLVDHARKTRADLIIVSSHGRKGIKRAMMGSFAESLVLLSDIPVIVFEPGTEARKSMKKILFPTDLSKESWKAYQELIPFAKSMKAHVLLHHNLTSVYEPYIYSGMPLYNVYQADMGDLLAETEKLARKSIKQKVEWARSRGVRVTAVFTRKAENVAITIRQLAQRRKVDLIAVASESSRIGAILLGSVSRQVLRNADRPVWVVHPRIEKTLGRRSA